LSARNRRLIIDPLCCTLSLDVICHFVSKPIEFSRRGSKSEKNDFTNKNRQRPGSTLHQLVQRCDGEGERCYT
jgi:hypothetical protein